MKQLLSKTLIATALTSALAIPSAVIAADDTNKADNKEQKWDVSVPRGDVKTIQLAPDESTWSNLDVSPNGKTVLFDMLGDIYTMPISGGATLFR